MLRAIDEVYLRPGGPLDRYRLLLAAYAISANHEKLLKKISVVF